eukprot:TRINITY_DN1498_c0_g1_i1.p1 TRINITY_DN1498_c0_g1~~TRINITY_DN1498_c0_g1_i1.p1  ORF type:complete len:272 (-),score=83.49 TRINITY_DN1498_c0_g1_i1:44-859(-)
MNAQALRVALELAGGQTVAVFGENETEVKTLSDALKEYVAPGAVVGEVFADAYPSISDSSCDVVIVHGTSTPLNVLFQAFRVLRTGATLACYEPLESRTADDAESLNKNLTLAGFVDSHVESEGKFVKVVCKKPNWEIGAQEGIKLKPKSAGAKKWTVEDLEDDMLVDEKDLLSEADLASPDMSAVPCGTGAVKKACKNCTCGLAEELAAESAPKKKLTLEMIENPGVNSSCGSCSLGDAFRCAGCPYRGLPAYTPGQKIELPDDFNIDDL